MEPRTLQYMAEAADAQQLSGLPDTLVQRVCSDSRQVQPGDLFVALRGERFDGHAFLPQVEGKGLAGVLIERAQLPRELPACGVLAAENTRVALGRIGARYRRDFAVPVIAVAGSNGKTTTKELLAAVLGQRFRTVVSRASFNNDIGVPTTLLELGREHEVAVLEFGTNHPGELAPLLRLAQPRFGVLTSIGREHLEFFGDLQGVIREEGELAEALPADGKLFLNGDSPGAEEIIKRAAAPTVRVGFGPENEWRARFVRMDGRGVGFEVESPQAGFNREFRICLLGKHQVVNALLAVALGAELGLDPEQVARGLAACLPAKMRMELWNWNEVVVLDDTYNANADSMRAALDTLAAFPCRGRRFAVLGNMAELGRQAAAAHLEVGRYAAALGLEQLFVVGRSADELAHGARAAGLSRVQQVADVEAAAELLRQSVRGGDVVLLKASRAAALDRIGQILRQGDRGRSEDDMGQGLNSLGKR